MLIRCALESLEDYGSRIWEAMRLSREELYTAPRRTEPPVARVSDTTAEYNTFDGRRLS